MRNASPQEPCRQTLTCECCGRTIVTAVEDVFSNPAVGSPRRFCDAACRQAAWRRRRAGVEEDTPLQRRGGRSRNLRPERSDAEQRTSPRPHLRSGKEVIATSEDPSN